MADERLAPDGIVSSLNYSTINLTDINEDPDSDDGDWGIWDGNGNTVVLCSFPTPSDDLTTGANVQGFRCLLRKNESGGNDAVWNLQLYQNNVLVSTVANGTTTSTSGEVVEGLWDATTLTDISGVDVEVRLQQFSGATGLTANRRAVEIGAFEWNAVVPDAGAVVTPDATSAALTAAQAPTLVLGTVTLTPDPTSAAFEANLAPSFVFGSVTLAPDPTSAALTADVPVLVLGGLIVTPNATAAALTAGQAPTLVIGGVIQTPDPIAATFTTGAPTVINGISVAPDAVAANFATGAPTLVLGAVIQTPSPVSAVFTAAVPVTLLGTVTLVPDATGANFVAAAPLLVIGSVTLLPDATSATFGAPGPLLIIGQLTMTPDPTSAAFGLTVPTVAITAGGQQTNYFGPMDGSNFGTLWGIGISATPQLGQ